MMLCRLFFDDDNPYVCACWQVAQRFRDTSYVEGMEQMGVRLTGMPDAAAPTIAHVSNADVRSY